MDLEEYKQIVRLADWDLVEITVRIQPFRYNNEGKKKFKRIPSFSMYNEILFLDREKGSYKVIKIKFNQLLKRFNKILKEVFV